MIKNTVLTSCLICLIPAVSAASEWETQLGGGLMLSDRTSTDTDIEGSPFVGAYVEGYAARNFGVVRFAIDGRLEGIEDEGLDDVYESGPVHAGVFGLHLGREVNGTLLGGYVGYGNFDGYEDNDGWTVGLEAERDFGNGSVFGQLGYVDAVGDAGDNEFKGLNARLGYQGSISDRWDALAAVEYAYSSECFEDCGGDWGRYWSAEFGAAYEMKNDWEVVTTVRLSSINANTEDTGTDHSLSIGFRKTFGGKKPSSALRTPMGGFRAAGWMHPLD